jgi:hypothetical protein
MTDSVHVLLDKMDENFAAISALYNDDLASKAVSPELLYAINHLITDASNALDWTSTAVARKFGKPNARPYFPLVPMDQGADAFTDVLEGQIPGLSVAHSNVADAFGRHQHYTPGNRELGYLKQLARGEKHGGDFSAQTRDETRWIEVGGTEGSIGFRPFQSGKGGVQFGGQVFLDGVEVDPQTLQPLAGGPRPFKETIYVDWQFVKPAGVSVLPALDALRRQVRSARQRRAS